MQGLYLYDQGRTELPFECLGIMMFLHYDASKDSVPQHNITIVRCYHDKILGVHWRNGMRCHRWLFRLCK